MYWKTRAWSLRSNKRSFSLMHLCVYYGNKVSQFKQLIYFRINVSLSCRYFSMCIGVCRKQHKREDESGIERKKRTLREQPNKRKDNKFVKFVEETRLSFLRLVRVYLRVSLDSLVDWRWKSEINEKLRRKKRIKTKNERRTKPRAPLFSSKRRRGSGHRVHCKCARVESVMRSIGFRIFLFLSLSLYLYIYLSTCPLIHET